MGRAHNPAGGGAAPSPRPAAVLAEACREEGWLACRATLTGHTGWVTSVAVSRDGATLVSGSGDDTVRVWDLVYIYLVKNYKCFCLFKNSYAPLLWINLDLTA